MDVDLSRLPTGTTGWLALVAHALTLGDLSEVDYLELKGQLPFAERQSRRRAAVVLSRAILGMANRMPDLAERHLGGFGVVLVGIDKAQNVVASDPVDGAILRDAIEPYVGEDGPQWDHQFVDHPDGLILALIVDVPRWGDGIHACRREYSDASTKLTVRDGDVFVRVPGQTRPATSHDLSNLERRRSRAPHTGAQVSVGYEGSFDRVSRASVRKLVESMVDSAVDDLLQGLPSTLPRGLYGTGVQAVLAQAATRPDRRSPDRFRSDVSEWQEQCRSESERVVTEFLRHDLSKGSFVLRNESDRYLESVRVQVSFPPGAAVLMASDTDYCDHGDRKHQFQVLQLLPDRPAPYGTLKPLGYDFRGLVEPSSMVRAPGAPKLSVQETSEGYVVSWYVGDLPPRDAVHADEAFAIFIDVGHEHSPTVCIAEDHDPMPLEIGAGWQVTAKGIDHVFAGDLALACKQDPGAALAWHRGE